MQGTLIEFFVHFIIESAQQFSEAYIHIIKRIKKKYTETPSATRRIKSKREKFHEARIGLSYQRSLICHGRIEMTIGHSIWEARAP